MLSNATAPASAVAPSLNETVPLITAVPPAVTVAVKVIGWPNVDVGGAALTVVVVSTGNAK